MLAGFPTILTFDLVVVLFLYHLLVVIPIELDSEQQGPEPTDNVASLGWDELVGLRRRLNLELKEQSGRLVQIDRELTQTIQSSIRNARSEMEGILEQSRQNKDLVGKQNALLLSVSDKISQSRNFLSLMQSRLPSESETEIGAHIQAIQAQFDTGQYKNEREKSELLSRLKDTSMKLEAIRATRMVSEQLAQLTEQATKIRDVIMGLEAESEQKKSLLGQINGRLDELYDSKRRLASEKDSLLSQYTDNLKRFESVNLRMDSMAEMRKRQREQYGYSIPDDALFKVKESARKKLEAGSKLSLDELKLLYEDKE